jgi:cellulose synthase/poly-beta-1,6-N-acetylglucosamine synthase-like glycosyltransferase
VDGFLLSAVVLSGVALLCALLLTLQVYEHKRFVRVSLSSPPAFCKSPPAVLVCVPCKGIDLGLADNLRCVLQQDYPKYRVRFIVDSADDPARAVIEKLTSQTAVSCELLVAGTCNDCGQKVHNLCYATAELPDDVALLVFFDSDARPAPDAVTRFVNCCCRGGLQVATGYRWFVPQHVTWPNLTLCSINSAVASLLKHHGCNLIWGGSWAITRELFEKTGIRDAWRGTLSDDLVATRTLRLAGVRIVFEPGCMATSPIDTTWKQAITFLRRQFLICRCYAPVWWWVTVPFVLVPPLILFGGLPLAAVLAHEGYAFWSWPLLVSGTLYVLTILRGRWRQAVWRPRVQGEPQLLQAAARFDEWAAPVSCLIAALTILMSAVGRSITWRGIHYHIGAAGRITMLGRVPDEQQRRILLEANDQRRDQEKAARRMVGATS